MAKLKFNYNKGFTLIELLVAIAIMVLLLLISIPSFRYFGKQAQLKSTANELKTLIDRTKTLSLAPNVADKSPSAYQIIINNSGEWIINYIDSKDQIQKVESGKIDKQITISKIVLDPAGAELRNSATINFQIPTGKINYERDFENQNYLKIYLNHSQINNSSQVILNLITAQTEVKNI